MKQFAVWACLLGWLLFSELGSGAPVKGSRAFVQQLSARSMATDGKLLPGKYELSETFRGGRRACVIVKGDHRPVVEVGVYVYDAGGRLVAKDDGGRDFVAAIWYPPRDAPYRIVIHNTGAEFNDCYIVLK